MKIEIDIPDPIFFQLGEIAESKDIKISWLIVHAIRDLLGAETTRLGRITHERKTA